MENETVEKVVTTQTPSGNVQTQTITRSGSPFADFFVSKVNQVIFSIIGIIAILLMFRVLFLLLGANQVGIVSFIINLTQVFVAPFVNIFPSASTGNSYLDVASIVAIIMYFAFGFILSVIIDLFSSKTTN